MDHSVDNADCPRRIPSRCDSGQTWTTWIRALLSTFWDLPCGHVWSQLSPV